MKVRKGSRWRDKKTGDLMRIGTRNGDKWHCIFDRSKRTMHNMSEFIINKYYEIVEE